MAQAQREENDASRSRDDLSGKGRPLRSLCASGRSSLRLRTAMSATLWTLPGASAISPLARATPLIELYMAL